MSRKVLIVDDNEVERTILSGFLKSDFDILSAANGEDALVLMRSEFQSISAVVLDLMMRGMDGFAVLKAIREDATLRQLPIIIATSLEDDETRKKAIAYGANGFITKPYTRDLLLYTVLNAVRLRETAALSNTVWRDNLTGLLNRESFFIEAERTIRHHEPGYYVLTCFDVENFKTINDQYGSELGDEVLRHIAACLNSFARNQEGLACRFMGDKFAILYPAKLRDTQMVKDSRERIMAPPCINRGIRIRVGRYIVSDPSIPISDMYDRAVLAETSVKGRYDTYIAEYSSAMIEKLRREQGIINEMVPALYAGEFIPWYQPQYNHATGALIGAEALVRWKKDGRFIPPGDFIPIFEQNGFIYEMDQSIWRQVCVTLRRWLDEGKSPLPVSVNVSRYDMLQDNFVSVISGLVDEYRLPIELLRLEITESAFSQASERITRLTNELIARGFTVEIDDFGSGYSSLNTLKDVPATILKLDMRFLEDSNESKRGGSILESVVRMAKWLGMSVIAEGVEEKAQADYLKSIGCYYIQGYYYAKPMPVEAYEAILCRDRRETELIGVNSLDTLNRNEFWDPKSMETLIFNSYVGGAAIIEYHRGSVVPLRVNERFTQEFQGAFLRGVPLAEITPENCMDDENLRVMYGNIDKAIQSKRESTCEVRISGVSSSAGSVLYLRCTVRLIAWTEDRFLLYCVIYNTTKQRLAEQKEYGMNAELLDNLPCGAGLFEYNGKGIKTLYLNRQFWELSARRAKKYEEIDVFQAVHADDRDGILPEIAEAISQKRDALCDVRITHGTDGYRRFHVVVRISRKSENGYSLYAFFIPSTDRSLLLEEQNRSKREKNRLDFIFKHAAISVWSYNAKTGEIIQNERSSSVHGFGAVVSGVPESLVKSGFVHPDSADEYLAMYAKLQNGETEAEGVFRVRNADRNGYWFEHIRYAAISGDGDKPDLFFGISSDVSAEHEQDNAIHQWMALLSEMQVENNAICEFNLTRDQFVRKQGNLFPAFQFSKTDSFDAYILAWVRQNVLNEDADKVIDYLNRDKLLAMHRRGVLDGGIDYRAVIDGAVKWCSLSIKFAEYPDDDDVRLIMVHTDINARKEDELRLIEENRHDSLTGALNRKAFERQVNEVIAATPDATHALFMIDLDNFKSINDNFGHMAGDRVLKRTADGLHSLLRSDDLVGRIGGDEFMVFLQNIPNRDVIARRAQMILDMMLTVIDGEGKMSGSIGVAITPKDGSTFEQLYRCADIAAYYSKQHGKNRFTFYDVELGAENGYGETVSEIDIESGESAKLWDERIKQVMAENLRLIERQEEDERYRLVIESTHIITFEWNALTGKFAASPEFSQYVLSEQGSEQFFSENVDVSGIHPDDRALFYGKFLEKVLSGESAQETCLRLALRDGGYRWCRLGALVYFDKAERLQKAIGILTEENVQKKQSDIQLDAIFKFMSAGVMLLEIKQPTISALYISESYFRLENADDLAPAQDDALCYVHPEDVQRLRNNLLICSISGAVMEETFRVVHHEKVFWRHMHAVRIPYPDAVDPVMIAVETDITDIKLREAKLERRQDLIASMLDQLSVIRWRYYPKERRAVMKPECAEILHVDQIAENAPECFINSGLVHPEDIQAFLTLHHKLDEGEEFASAVVRIRRPDGGYTRQKIVYIGMLDKDGKHYCAVGVSEPMELE